MSREMYMYTFLSLNCKRFSEINSEVSSMQNYIKKRRFIFLPFASYWNRQGLCVVPSHISTLLAASDIYSTAAASQKQSNIKSVIFLGLN